MMLCAKPIHCIEMLVLFNFRGALVRKFCGLADLRAVERVQSFEVSLSAADPERRMAVLL